ncbi:MAG TPA: phosphopentomutase [Anaerolineae bacterium]|nr:phosphopentomutase [Anaerolineae bacterium]
MWDVERVAVVVLDGVGVGALPDAADFGDEGSNSVGNTARAVGGLALPNMSLLGLGNLTDVVGVPPVAETIGAYGRMAEVSAGKDSTTGHWELTGVVSPVALPTYPQGFPRELIEEYERRIGRKTLGNVAISGTVIIDRLGAEHMRTGSPIVYTSADSVFQVAAHEEIMPLNELYRICLIAREMLTGEHAVGRVIARPFVGQPGSFTRTQNRRDFSLVPPKPTLLDRLLAADYQVVGVGKVDDLFAKQGLTVCHHTVDNLVATEKVIELLGEESRGMILANLIEFDMLFGHRNNPEAYARALEAFDSRLPRMMEAMKPGDVLFIVADHGNDPTTPSTDHSREYVPLLVYGERVRPGVNLGTRESFADLAATIAELLGIEPLPNGTSFAREIMSGA